MYITVIPTSHSIGTTPLTYYVGDVFHLQITIGSLIEIPVGKNIEYGIVAEFTNDVPPSNTEIKSIVQVLSSVPLLAPYQIDVIVGISRYYMIPIHRILGIFLPKPVMNRMEKKNFSLLENQILKTHPHTPQNQISFFQNSIITPEILSQYIQPYSVFVCPDMISLRQYEKVLRENALFFFPKNLTDTQRAKTWIDIHNGIHPILFGTRKMLFFPLARYQRIYYLEDAFSYEYFHYPNKLHYNDILHYIDKTQTFDIHILTSLPLIKTLSMFRHFSIKNII